MRLCNGFDNVENLSLNLPSGLVKYLELFKVLSEILAAFDLKVLLEGILWWFKEEIEVIFCLNWKLKQILWSYLVVYVDSPFVQITHKTPIKSSLTPNLYPQSTFQAHKYFNCRKISSKTQKIQKNTSQKPNEPS